MFSYKLSQSSGKVQNIQIGEISVPEDLELTKHCEPVSKRFPANCDPISSPYRMNYLAEQVALLPQQIRPK